MFISSYQRDHFLKMCGNQYRPESQAFRNFCIWHRPAARSALPPRRPPWQIPPFAPCVALRLLHKQLGEKELPPPSRPSLSEIRARAAARPIIQLNDPNVIDAIRAALHAVKADIVVDDDGCLVASMVVILCVWTIGSDVAIA